MLRKLGLFCIALAVAARAWAFDFEFALISTNVVGNTVQIPIWVKADGPNLGGRIDYVQTTIAYDTLSLHFDQFTPTNGVYLPVGAEYNRELPFGTACSGPWSTVVTPVAVKPLSMALFCLSYESYCSGVPMPLEPAYVQIGTLGFHHVRTTGIPPGGYSTAVRIECRDLYAGQQVSAWWVHPYGGGTNVYGWGYGDVAITNACVKIKGTNNEYPPGCPGPQGQFNPGGCHPDCETEAKTTSNISWGMVKELYR